MGKKLTARLVVVLFIGFVLVVVATMNSRRASHDSGGKAVVPETRAEKNPYTAGSNESSREVLDMAEEADSAVLNADMEKLILDKVSVRQMQRDLLAGVAQRQEEEKALLEKYELSRTQPQSVRGSLHLPQGIEREHLGPVKLQLRSADRYSKVAQTMLDANGHYAFDPVKPGKYTLLVFETKATPGIHYRNLEVMEGQLGPELDVPSPSGVITVHLVDENRQGISGARITVGKTDAPSGSDLNFFTFRVGTSDAEGYFVAANLTDGRYVVRASYGQCEVSDVVVLGPKGRKEHTLKLRTSGSQIAGTVRRRDPHVSTSYSILLEGEDSDGNRIRRSINTDSKGEFVFSYMLPGTYRLYIQSTEQFSGTDAVVKVTGTRETVRNVNLDVYYPNELSSITGRVGNIGASPNVSLHVLANSDNDVLRSHAEVNIESGEFVLNGLPPGKYRVHLMSVKENGHHALEVSSKTVSVVPNATAHRVDFRLPSVQ